MSDQFLTTVLQAAITQAPVLTIVLVFLYLNNKEWRKYLTERNAKTEKSLTTMTDELKESNRRLFQHLDKHS